jgi:hypothetical protein
MPRISLLKSIGKGIRNSASASARGKALTLLEIASTGVVLVEFSDEIARAIMGEDYSPELRDLAEEVTEAGAAYDRQIDKVIRIGVDAENVVTGINSLTDIVLDYGDHQELVLDMLDKLTELRTTLNTTTPRTYSWFETMELRASNDKLTFEELEPQIEELKKVNGPNYLVMGFLGAEILLHIGYKAWAHWKGSGNRPRSNSLQGQPQANGTKTKHLSSSSIQRMRSRSAHLRPGIRVFSRARSVVDSVARKTGGLKEGTFYAATFAVGIYFLVKKGQTHKKAMNELRAMLADYKEAIPCYKYIVDGEASGADINVDDVVAFFDIDTSDFDDNAHEALRSGFSGVQAQYDTLLSDILDGMDLAYGDLIDEFQEVAATEDDQNVINSLKTARAEHQAAQAQALDTSVSGEKRLNSITEARDIFINSVSEQLNETLQELSVAIDNHNALQMIVTAAGFLAEEKQQIAIDMAQLRADHPELPESVFDFFRKDKEKALEDRIVTEAERLFSDFEALFPTRSRFQSELDVEDTLRISMEEQAASTTAETPEAVVSEAGERDPIQMEA